MYKKTICIMLSVFFIMAVTCSCGKGGNAQIHEQNSATVEKQDKSEAVTPAAIIETSSSEINYKPDDNGVMYEYHFTDSGKWVVKGKKFKYRITLNGQMPNSSGNTTYVVLSNRRDVSFDEINDSIFSSNSGDHLDENEVFVVEMR
ncbi:MAG: hypothetical protein K6G63_00775 [Eubacterium sp.]|nr:hypothetical protein [Eubacterium sp.]